jgi:hypothetical protein
MQDDGKRRGVGMTGTLSVVLFVAVVAALVWGSDRITLQGERTIYTVQCDRGTWEGNTCSGKLVPDKRYAFRASKARREVLYWMRGSDLPSGMYRDCTVVDRDNWACKAPAAGTPATIAFEMAKGRPARAEGGLVLPFHSVPKWKWWLMDAGIGVFTEAGD